jgi:hypothetical protein
MDMEEKFLPIGTVVLLKGGKRELMINSYCIIPNGEVYDKSGKIDATGTMYDYGACFYPEGMVTSDQLFAFNHEQIDRICFKGYVTDKQKEISKVLVSGLEEMKKSLEKQVEVKEDQAQ